MTNLSGNKQMLRLLFWESTIRCNLSCVHCRRLESDEAVDADLTTPQAMRLIDQLARAGQAQASMPILVFSGGEPLCRNDLFELIEAAVSKELKCAVATNGTLIDNAIAEKIRAAGVARVSVSLDGATADVHNKLRCLDGAFEAAIEGIRYLRQCAVPFQINMTITRYNVHQLDDIFSMAKKLGAAAVHFFMLVPVGCGGELTEAQMLSAVEYERLLERIAEKTQTVSLEVKVTCAPHYDRILHQNKLKNGHPSKGCLAGSGILFVSHRGQVFPCGYLPVDCGNILCTPLEQIWTGSEDLARMRDPAQLKGKCGMCQYAQVCGGCRARAFAATGDYLQSEPMCVFTPGRKGPS